MKNDLLDVSNKLKLKKGIYLLISVIIAFLFALPEDITWARDRLNYLTYAESSSIIIQRYLSTGILSIFSNEPLFLVINIILLAMFPPEQIVRIIIFISTLGVLYALGKVTNYSFWIIILFLFIPQIVKNHIIHLRQGLGLSFYLIGLTLNNKFSRYLKVSAVFIHSSFAFLILFEILESFLKKIKFNFALRLVTSTIFLTFFVFLVPELARLFGDRRAADYDFSIAQSASGLGFLLWAVAGSIFILTIKKDKINVIACYGIMFYLVSYFFLDFGARILENIIPLILCAVLKDQKETKIFFIIFLTIYGFIQWYTNGYSFLI
ncbi:EpsG family protein [Metabacillus mangrovi]|uniref:EpsG family protein n=1 Tax=Metabacillus mangrovi TaxID=1491830 RepID=UPI0012BAEB00|nr:EpsG family protein [Metabacillus mangrovi]